MSKPPASSSGPQLDPQHPAFPGLRAIVADRGYTGLAALARSRGLNLDIKKPPARPLLPAKPGKKAKRAPGVFTPIAPLYKVENAFARLGMWRRLSRCYEQTAIGARTWMEVACLAYLCGRFRVEPT
jgi:putative transposase